MFLKVLTSFAALAGARHVEVSKHAMLQESVQVTSDGVIRLAAQQAGYWRASKASMSALSAKAEAAQDSMDAKVEAMITTQQSADESCHSSLYRFQNAMNQLHFQLNMSYSVETTLVEQVTAEEAIIKDLEDRINRKHAEYEERLKECAAAKADACQQHETYSAELKELQELGSSPVTPISMFQAVMRRASRKAATSRQLELLGVGSSSSLNLSARRLVSSSRALQACMARTGQRAMSALELKEDPTTTAPPTTIAAHESVGAAESDRQYDNVVTFSPEQCEEERAALEEQWRKSYLILEDLVEETGNACNDMTCEEAVEEERSSELPPLNTERSERIDAVRRAQNELVDEKEKLEDLESAFEKLEQVTRETAETCDNEEIGSEYLEAVRDLVKSMKNCPGLTGAVFEIPAFRKTVELGVNLLMETDETTDGKMQQACKNAADAGDEDTIRAAKQSELDQRMISGLPETNTATMSILGLCPTCAGDTHAAASSGHKRKCFRTGGVINATAVSADCLGSSVLAVCVVDRSLAEHEAAKTTTVAP
eukprot:CAMPEP_0204268708 /NCGR_PEP_ID=MMETSP0468-20130131/14080_1 /ASSEMBLY_ACC=CAM_ASM_000383 /TAXON_ID=2969 /ORGANISM="Oxyrrhis marina" /LENGTH=542 /DNA_ID=CAMNT_0051244001 /DNA_START=84 /DNA_END=1712 /DNA_ORIENTATION=-